VYIIKLVEIFLVGFGWVMVRKGPKLVILIITIHYGNLWGCPITCTTFIINLTNLFRYIVSTQTYQ
jgi:hypothetical protein